MRKSCAHCVLKHLCQAHILLTEWHTGKQRVPPVYTEHFYLALGHLSEAYEECLDQMDVAQEIDALRMLIVENKDVGFEKFDICHFIKIII